MKIVYIDTIIFDLQRAGGISVYFYEIIKRLLADEDIESYFIVSDAEKNNVYWDKLDLPSGSVIKYDKFMNRYRSVNYNETRKHIFISSYYRYSTNKNAVNLTIVHDFTYEYFSHRLRKWVHHHQKMKAVKRSGIVVCISKNTQKDLNKFAHRDVNSHLIYNGVGETYRLMSEEEIAAAAAQFEPAVREVVLGGKFVLFVGKRGGYKNWLEAAQLFKKMPAEYSMISVGSDVLDEEEKTLLGDGLSRHYRLSGLEEEQLCLLYNKAYCLLYLSEYEGFGLPVVEATRCGCPVVAHNSSSIPELAEESKLITFADGMNVLPLDFTHGAPETKFTWDDTYSEIKDLI